MKETITIKNFGGLKNVTIPLNSINIFIGKQASGKSVTAKLIYFFRKIFEDIFDGISENKQQREINRNIKNRFEKYFPAESWTKGKFTIEYKFGDANKFSLAGFVVFDICGKSISISNKKNGSLEINYKEVIKELESLQRAFITEFKNKKPSDFKKIEDVESAILDSLFSANPTVFAKMVFQLLAGQEIQSICPQMFIPAGRAYFSNIQSSLFSILARGETIDPFIIEFGQIYEMLKRINFDYKNQKIEKFIQDGVKEILDADYVIDQSKEFLVHRDKRKVPLLFSSSGQQEAFPLILLMKLIYIWSLSTASFSLYIEEPEAHLFPSAQKKIVEIIATAHNLSKGKSQLVITTHSPYILTSFNNLLQAGQLLESGANKRKLFKIVPEFEILKPGELNAYAFEDGGVTSLIDEETGLISAELLDKVSEEIAIQFEQLLDL